MSPAEQLAPFDVLRQLESLCQQGAAGLPQQRAITKPWTGIGFRIGNVNLVAAVDDVREILYYPRLAVVPGAKGWVRGVANIRGTLMPIIDLKHYLGQTPVDINARSRVLIIHYDELWAGLLVDAVAGLKHFQQDTSRSVAAEMQAALKSYLVGAYQHQNTDWYVFSFKDLAESPEFVRIAA
ncbi:MAG: purine-binding chemotaxis protein CheW [Gammaproteobacteria bacterium]|nr:purine-binding chemotaxis protein CheW [Gammaproteobacteria bacterium]